MCGRYIANSEDEITEIREILKQISLRFVSAEFDANSALSDIYPTNKVMIINKSDGVTPVKWGIEKWDGKAVIINAKSETYEQSGFFKPFAKNRCVIPAHGYYEWMTMQDKSKQKYAFTSKNNKGIFMTGIMKPSQEKLSDNNRFAIITRPAQENILHIHARMPLIIFAEQIEQWLSGKLSVQDIREQDTEITFEQAV